MLAWPSDLAELQEEEGSQEAHGEVQFIDFEYTEASYRSFDIANHFNEYAGFECDYSRFPDDAHVTQFVTEYLQEGASEHTARPSQCLLSGLVVVCYYTNTCMVSCCAANFKQCNKMHRITL